MSNYRERKGLTIYQKLLIKELASHQKTIRELATQVQSDYQKTYDFVMKNNLPAKLLPSAKKRVESKIPRSGMFVVSSQQNWLV